MKANKGEWFCLQWDIVDFYDPISFQQFKDAPRFLFAEEDSGQIEGDIINEFDRIRLISVSRVGVFVTDENDDKMLYVSSSVEDKESFWMIELARNIIENRPPVNRDIYE